MGALFVRRCRKHHCLSHIPARAASTSPFSPATFNKKYSSPITTPSPVASAPSNLPNSPAISAPSKSERLDLSSFLDRQSSQSPAWARPKARPTAIEPAHSATSFWNYMRRKLGLRIPKKDAPTDPFNVWNNPYRAHKAWPPKLLELNHKQQLHFEKTYRRRAALKWERPVFTRWVTLIQNSVIAFVVFYAVFVYEPEEGTVFDGFRAWVWRQMGDSDMVPERVRNNSKKKAEEFDKKWVAMKDTFFEITPVAGLKTSPPVNPDEQKIPWAQRQRKDS